MRSGTVEPECRRRQWAILSEIVDLASGADVTIPTLGPILLSTDDAPNREATKAVTHATIHVIALGAAPAGRAPFPIATQTSGGTKGATGWANSIAVN